MSGRYVKRKCDSCSGTGTSGGYYVGDISCGNAFWKSEEECSRCDGTGKEKVWMSEERLKEQGISNGFWARLFS